MMGSFEAQLSPDQDLCAETEMSRDFYKQLKLSNDLRDLHKEEEEDEEATENHDDNDDEEDEEEEVEEEAGEEEFSFMCGGDATSPIAAEDAFINGQIKAVFPLFNRELFFSGDESDSLHENLPMKPPVKKVFVETEDSHAVTASTEGSDEVVGPYCQWSNGKAVEVSPEVCKKSNSTGFSKLWRFKDFMGRSNSDGRDAFVFLNHNHNHPPPSATEAPATTLAVAFGGRKGEEQVEKKVSMAKVRKSGKTKTASLSAHEVYLRSKAKNEEKRRSYLPYRPELMGFFTNINSGLSKNVHPF